MLIAHLSDPHLRPPGQLYQGLVASNEMFAQAIEHLNALRPAPDVVLLSGDLTDTGSASEYATAHEMLAAVRQPLLAIPGNHDKRDAFRACFADRLPFPRSGALHLDRGDLGPVRIIGLDVTVPGEHHGDMNDEACLWLEQRLSEQPDRPTLVMLHHPPFTSGIPFIDAYNCRRGDRLATIITRYPSVERVLCGHIHRFMQLRFGGSMLLTAPSTTTAIALRLYDDAGPASFIEPPAFLLHHWRPQVGLITHLVPIGEFRGPLPFF